MVDGRNSSMVCDPGKLLKVATAALCKEFLRQHYLDQVLGSPAFRAGLSAFVVFWTAGWLPVD